MVEKTGEIRKLENKVKVLENLERNRERKINLEMESSDKIRAENKKLLASVEALMEKAQDNNS